MSHFVEVKGVKVNDLGVLETVAHQLGLELVRGQQTYKGYTSERGRCDHALVSLVPGATEGYEIGLVAAPGGGWTLGWDTFYTGGAALQKLCGDNMGRLLQAYGVELVRQTAQQTAGMQVLSQTTLANGVVAMRVMAS